MADELPELRWPGEAYAAANLDSGWVHVEQEGEETLELAAPLEGVLSDDDPRALVLEGERLTRLESLHDAIGSEVALAYIDIPRLDHASFERGHLKVATWLSLVRSHTRSASRLVREGGRVVVHVDDAGAALAMELLDGLFGREHREATILWQKKYAPQNDLTGRIDDAQDYLLVYRIGADANPSDLQTTWWSWKYAGKSEDATREAEALRDEGVITLQVIPKTSKPELLIDRLLAAYTGAGDIVLECFSDTGFASATAVKQGRRAILLTGATAEEGERAERCSIPRLRHVVDGEGRLQVVDGPSPSYRKIAVSAKDEPVRFGPSGSAGRENSTLRSVVVRPTGTESPPEGRVGMPSLRVTGEVLSSLSALEPVVQCDVTLAVIEGSGVLEEPAEALARFQAVARLLSEEGVVAIPAGPGDYGSVRLLAEFDAYGRSHYLGTIALRRADSEEGDYTLVPLFKGLPQARTGKIGLPAERGYEAEDGDPRGAWRDPQHKGARSGGPGTAFQYRIPPYRWEVIEGDLPPGCWRLNPISGVIWGAELREPGEYRFTVRVKDSRGSTSQADCIIEVLEDGLPEYPAGVWWMDEEELDRTNGEPVIESERLPDGVVGHSYSAVLQATGGAPWDDTKAPGEPTEGGGRTRYWEFSRNTLVGAILEDRALFGATGTASPRRKVYKDGESATTVVELSWWDRERLGKGSFTSRLLEIFTDRGDLVCSAGDVGVPAREPIRLGRRHIRVGSEDDGDTADGAFPLMGHLGPAIASWEAGGRVFVPEYGADSFDEGLAWVLGFLPPSARRLAGVPDETRDVLLGVTADGSEALVALGPDEWPTASRCTRIADLTSDTFARTQVLYYRGKPPRGIPGVSFRRVPFDFSGGS